MMMPISKWDIPGYKLSFVFMVAFGTGAIAAMCRQEWLWAIALSNCATNAANDCRFKRIEYALNGDEG